MRLEDAGKCVCSEQQLGHREQMKVCGMRLHCN